MNAHNCDCNNPSKPEFTHCTTIVQFSFLILPVWEIQPQSRLERQREKLKTK